MNLPPLVQKVSAVLILNTHFCTVGKAGPLLEHEDAFKKILDHTENILMPLTYYISYGQAHYLLRDYLKAEV
jgi:hypothetical protein